MMTSITRWVLSHRRLVVAFWIVTTVVGLATANKAANSFDQKFSVPGREGWQTAEQVKHIYKAGGENLPLLPVVTLPAGKTVASPGVRGQLAEIDRRAAKAIPGARIASFASTGDRAFVSKDGRTAFAVVYPRPPNNAFGDDTVSTKALRHQLRGVDVAGAQVRVTGFDALAQDTGGGDGGTGLLLEVLIGALGALAVLGFVFASLLVFLPMLMAIVAIPTTFLAVWSLTTVPQISPIVQFLIALVGLGIAIDYALIIVVRWREERAHGHDLEEATVRSMATAGRAVVFSGTTVAIGLLALIALPLPFLRSMGYGGLLIPLVSTAVAITLLPVLLVKWGNRLDWPHKRSDDKASRAWTRWAEGVVRHRWLAAGVSLLILGALAYGATDLNLGTSNPDVLAKHGDARVGLEQLERSGIGSGALAPYEVLSSQQATGDVVASVGDVDGIHGAVAPKLPTWQRERTAVVEAFPIPNPATKEARDLVNEVKDAAHPAGPAARVSGSGAQDDDFIDAVYGSFPLLIALIPPPPFPLSARRLPALLLPPQARI